MVSPRDCLFISGAILVGLFPRVVGYRGPVLVLYRNRNFYFQFGKFFTKQIVYLIWLNVSMNYTTDFRLLYHLISLLDFKYLLDLRGYF